MFSLLFLGSILVSTIAFPDKSIGTGGFKPLPQARGVPHGQVFSRPQENLVQAKISAPVGQAGPVVDNVQAGSNIGPVYGGPGGIGGAGGVGGSGVPTQTFYVNVPQEQYPAPAPIAAGPPRKHYRIVLIRAPSPPPPQPILPPRLEQKTLIYVLHPRPQLNQEVLEVPSVKHDPQVYFIQYDDEPPTQEDLQELVKNTIDGHGSNVNFGANNNYAAGNSAPAAVYAPGPQSSFGGNYQGNGISERQAPNYEAELAPELPQKSKPLPVITKAQQQPRQAPQQPKYIRTRSASREVGPSDAKKIPSSVKQQPFSSKFAINPVEPSHELKSAFGDSFTHGSSNQQGQGDINRPFRFGSKLQTRRSQTNNGELAKENKS